MEQTTIFKKHKKSCAFTGHRQLGEEFNKTALKNAVKTAIKEGVDTFYCGMAMGFDLLAAETVLQLKEEFQKIRLVACVPCYGQEKSFSKEDKARYVEALKNADEQIVLSERYYRGCMQVRDKYMAERADMLIAYCKKETGGAAYTVKIFQKLCPDGEIVFL